MEKKENKKIKDTSSEKTAIHDLKLLITDPYDWKQHPNLNITLVKSVKSVKSKMLKIINGLVMRVSGQSFAYPSSSDPIWIATKKTNKKTILGICMLSTYSPNKHFNNERSSTNVPYLYNFAIDTRDVNTKVLKVSVSLMMRLKIDLMQNMDIWKWLNPKDPCHPKYLNLDVLIESGRAENFYQKNGFKGDKIYNTFGGIGKDWIEFRMLSFGF